MALSFSVFAYDIVNEPSSAELAEDITINLQNNQGIITLTKVQDDNQIVYNVELHESSIKIPESDLDKKGLIDNVILALNLLMIYGVLDSDKRPKAKLNRNEEGLPMVTIKLGEIRDVTLTDKPQPFSFSMPYPPFLYGRIEELIDGQGFLNLLNDENKLDLNSVSYKPDGRSTNLKNSLRSYRSAMKEQGAVDRFKFLFNSLELLLNSDGGWARGDDFDEKVTSESGLDKSELADPKETVATWRVFYNKLKHGTRDEEEVKIITSGMSELYKTLPLLRQVVVRIMDKRMHSI